VLDDKIFVAALATLSETFARPLGDGAVEGYRIGLSDLSNDQLRQAMARALRESKFMPTPKELRDYVEGPTRITGAMQWAHVRKTMDKLDIYGSPDFGPAVNAVVHALGGWKVLCEKSIPDLVWIQKDFERLYTEFSVKDLSGLRTEGHVGEFGKPPEWCAIEGTPRPPKQLESAERHQVLGVVRELAEAKS
jgi:hypothetical protein